MANFSYTPPDTEPAIIDLNADWIIVNKPSGLLSVPGRGSDKQDCLLSRVQTQYPEALIVHRLDMGTSGLIMLARHATAQRALSRLFAERKIHKSYLAIVSGTPELPTGMIDQPLITDWPNRPRQKIDHEQGKPALTHYATLSYDPVAHTSRLHLTPQTGRSHQLRVHLQFLGHPILGDDLYAPEAIRHQAKRLLLHAAALHFTWADEMRHLICPADF